MEVSFSNVVLPGADIFFLQSCCVSAHRALRNPRQLTCTEAHMCPSALLLLLPGGAEPSPTPPVKADLMDSSWLLCLERKSYWGKTFLILLFWTDLGKKIKNTLECEQ